MRRRSLGLVLALVASLVAAAGAQAVVVNDQGNTVGVALVPGSAPSALSDAGVTTVTSGAPCLDPALPPDLILPDTGLCSHGGGVLHQNETFALAWDAKRRYWQTTRNYVEQFLQDVANGSGTLTSPYAVSTQYSDSVGRAQNSSRFGGACVDFGVRGGATCQFGSTNGSAPGNDYPSANSCPVTGSNEFHQDLSGVFDTVPNDICLTDADVKGELAQTIVRDGIAGHTQSGFGPLVVVLLPPGLEVCTDSAGNLCSANGASTAQFCSYHGQVNIGGTDYPYVIQPWTALTSCDDPSVPDIPQNPDAETLARLVGTRLVSPLSQAQLAATVNPWLTGWYALDGAEINDNGCIPLPDHLDDATVGGSVYELQREFNNAGVIESEPNAPACAPSVLLSPTFVAPSAVKAGDVVQLDGSTSASGLIIPTSGYVWDFGDGTGALGPSVTHSFAKAGNFSVQLTVTDRGGNVRSFSQTVGVLGPQGTVPPPSGSKTPSSNGLHVHLQLVPQGLAGVLRRGIALRVTSNEPANAITTISISRGAARRAHVRAGRKASVTIGVGTVSGIKAGTVTLHLHLGRKMVAKLRHLKHLSLTVRLDLRAPGGGRLAVDAAGRY